VRLPGPLRKPRAILWFAPRRANWGAGIEELRQALLERGSAETQFHLRSQEGSVDARL
jgi:hypothetical protein